MSLPPYSKHVFARLISGSVFLTAAGLSSGVFATPTISTPPSTLTVNENLALNSTTASVPLRTQLSFTNLIQLVAGTPADSTSTFKVRLSVNHGAVYPSTTTGLVAAGGSLFDAVTNLPVGPTLQHGPVTGIDSITFQGTFAQINAALNNLVYTPNIYYNGPDTLTIEVFNPGLPAVFSAALLASATAGISVVATAANQRKVALNDFNGVTQNQTASGNVLSNDLNPAAGLAVTAFTVGGTAGTVGTDFPIAGVGVFNLASNGAYTFKPDANYLGAIPEIAYTATDTSSYVTNSSLWLTMLPVTRVSGTADINAPDSSQALKADTDGNGVISEAEARAGVASYVDISTPNALSLAGGTYTKDINGVNIVPVTIRALSTNNPGGGWLQPSAAALTSMMDFGEWGTNVAPGQVGPLGPSFDFEMAFAKKTVARLSTMNAAAPGTHLNSKQVSTEVVSFVAKGATAGFDWIIPNIYVDQTNNPATNASALYGIQRIVRSTTNVTNDTITIYGSAPNHNTGPKVAYEVFTNQAVDGVTVHHKTVIYTNAQQVSGVQLAVQPLVNNPPVDPDDTNTAYKNTTLTVSAANGVLKGASDPDVGDVISVLWFQLPGDTTVYAAGQTASIAGVGTLQINADGSYVFTPAANYVGPVPVSTYTLTDGNGGLDTSTLTITMLNNDPPIDGNEVETTPQGTPLSKNVLTNATDPQNDPLSVTNFTVGGTTYNAGDTATIAGVGTLLINADGSYVFTPLASYSGAVPQTTYTVSDGHGGLDTSTLDITITPQVPAPGASTPEDTPVAVTGVSIPPAGTTVTTTVTVTNGTATVATGGATVTGNGSSTITITGTPAQVNDALKGLTFTNTPDYNGPASVTITPNNGAPAQTVPITVTPVVDVTDDVRTTPLNTPITIPVLDNDSFENPARVISEIDGKPVTVGTPITVANGTVTVQADNTVIFTPNKDYTGQAVFTYTVSAGGVKETANVTVTISGPTTGTPQAVPVGGGLVAALLGLLMAGWGALSLRRRQ